MSINGEYETYFYLQLVRLKLIQTELLMSTN